MRFTVLLLIISASLTIARLNEDERRVEYERRKHTWPATYVPNTEGWKKLMDRRFAQVTQIQNSGERYEGCVKISCITPFLSTHIETKVFSIFHVKM